MTINAECYAGPYSLEEALRDSKHGIALSSPTAALIAIKRGRFIRVYRVNSLSGRAGSILGTSRNVPLEDAVRHAWRPG